MAIPQYQEFMNPVLEAFADGTPKVHPVVESYVAPILNLSKKDLQELLPSETQTIVRNRVSWAIYYMYRAGLLEKVKRGTYKITDSGKRTLSSKAKVSNDYLNQFEGFRKFQEKTSSKKISSISATEQDIDPISRINNAVEEINIRTQDELLDKLKKVDPVYFEKICLDLMRAMGYGDYNPEEATTITPRSHDGGIDGIINEDALGLDKIYIQAKRYSDTRVCAKEMRNFLGALTERQSKKGIFITTSEFDKKATEMASKQNIALIDGDKLTQLMLKYNIAVFTKEKYEIKELNLSYFDED
jgi:restriction system protein